MGHAGCRGWFPVSFSVCQDDEKTVQHQGACQWRQSRTAWRLAQKEMRAIQAKQDMRQTTDMLQTLPLTRWYQMISDACRSCVIPRLSTRTRDINQVYFCHRNKLACTNLHGKRLTEVSLTRCAFCSKKLYSIAEWPWCNICTVLPCNVSYFFHQPAKHQSIDCCLFIGQIIMSQATACRGQDTPAGMSTVLQTAALSQATGPILETCWYCWYCLLPALSSPQLSWHS